MTYNKPEVINLTRALTAVQSQNMKQTHTIPDSFGSSFPYQTSSAYEADE